MKRIMFFSTSLLLITTSFLLSGCSEPFESEDSSTDFISHGKDITASNTGVPAGHVLSDVASAIVVTESWITASNSGNRYLENKNFLSGAGLQIKTGNFTVRYCKFNGKSGGSVEYGLSNVVIEYCEFDGQHLNTGGDCAIGIGGLTARRLHIHRWPRAFWSGWGDVHIEECYIHDVTADGGDAHLENIYIAGVLIRPLSGTS